MSRRTLPCKLTREERETRAASLAQAIRDRIVMEEEESSRKKAAKAKLDTLSDHIDSLAVAVSTGEEPREVDTREEPWLVDRVVRIVRVDTEAVVDERPMTPHELDKARQLALYDDADGVVTEVVGGRRRK
jgi:hypothetical protein